MSNFDNWVSYPFSVDGINFLSLINPNGDMYKTIKNMPVAIFNSYNEGAIRELIGSVSTMSKSEIQSGLDKANAGYSQAYLALA
mgnify:FL=1